MPITEAILRRVALSFPGAREEPHYGQPSFKIEKKFFTRLRREDASVVWMVDSIDERDNLIAMDPKTYFITDHYKNYPSVLVRTSRLNEAMLRKMLERRWRAIAPKKLVKAAESAAPTAKAAKRGLTKAQARKIALSFPGVTEKTSYGTPTFFVGKKLLTQIGSQDRTDIMLRTQTIEERDHLIAADPDAFYITDHFKTYKGLLARIDKLDAETFRALLERRWRAIAPRKLVKAVS